MKLKTKPMMALAICGGLLMSEAVLATAKPVISTGAFNDEEKPAKKEKEKVKEKTKTKTLSSLNNQSLKIYPDALKREMHVVAKTNDGKEIDFFVFDLQGTLVQNYKMQPKDHNRISGLARGTYVYRAFCGDEETAAGKFEIR